jgi:tetratricopeptide (TPR) repeat protein
LITATPSTSRLRWQVRAALILGVLIGLSYSQCLEAIWTLDDYPNILQNTRLHISDLLPETLIPSLYAPNSTDEPAAAHLNRPVSYLSFALNWYLGQDSPVGYRLVNIAIHYGNAFLLFLVIRALMSLPKMQGRFSGREGLVALLGAMLWAMNPVQSQATVYIVQRMASLACFFYLLGMLSYIRARQANSRGSGIGYLFLLALSFAAGVGSKENAILLPAALVLLEFCFFQDFERPQVRWWYAGVLAGVSLMIAVGAGWIAYRGGLESVFNYSARLFTPWERLMTQPRVVMFYLSQLFYPVPTRLSIIHDLEISRSILEPWTTFPAIAGVSGLIAIGLIAIKKKPILSFAILFYFLNHAVESSVIGLELIFEHRNYLPSLFLFPPVALGMIGLYDRYRARPGGFHYVISGFIVLWICTLFAGTYIRTLAWADAKTFWEDAAAKAPLSMRPLNNLAYEYFEKRGQREEALALYQKSITLADYNINGLGIAHNNIANCHYLNGEFEKAKEHLDQAVAASPGLEQAHYFRAFILLKTRNFQDAADELEPLLRKHPDSFRYSHLMARILIKLDRVAEALVHLRHCLELSPESAEAQALLGIALNLHGDYEEAGWHLRRALIRNPVDRSLLLWLAVTGLKLADTANAADYARRFLEGLPADQIRETVDRTLEDYNLPAASSDLLKNWLDPQAQAFGFQKGFSSRAD